MKGNPLMSIKENIQTLYQLMKEKNIDAYIVASSDPHQSEYVADHFKSRAFISGFTGSAGTFLAIREQGCYLWTDGRYFLQAEKELQGTGIELMRMGIPGVPTLNAFIKDSLKKGATVGFDGRTYSGKQLDLMQSEFKERDYQYKIDEDLMEMVWLDRPAMPKGQVEVHELQYAGRTIDDKLKDIREQMNKDEIEAYFVASLDDIAWLFNLRGTDILFSPVVYAYVYIDLDQTILYIDKDKLSYEVKEYLTTNKVIVKNYDGLWDDVKNLGLGKVVGVDPGRVNSKLYNLLKTISAKVIDIKEITRLLKAVKNQVEIENLRKCNIADNVAMVRFIKWLKESVGKEPLTELSVEEKLMNLRAEGENNKGVSFETIAGYGPHGAIIHYRATEESNSDIQPEGFLLVDSGGQYLGGTTDITRTFSLGAVTEEMKKHYTLVLRGHINLSKIKFPEGTKGVQVDILARQPLWEEGLEYRHGTGHGLGFYLNVHEGPQSISQHLIDQPLLEGMVITNEPGYYVEGGYGIRLENDVLVVKDQKTEWGQFYRFEPLTLCPFDVEAIQVEQMKPEEKQWLNEYHKTVYDTLAPHLTEEEGQWLREATRSL